MQEKRSARTERREANKTKEFFIKFTMIMLPVAICVHFIVYGKLMEKQYDDLCDKIIEYDGTIGELKLELKREVSFMAKKAGIRYDIKIMHPKVNGGSVETFEESIGCLISEIQPEMMYARTKIGILPRMTYDYLTYTSNSVLLEAVQCANCKEHIMMTTQAVMNQDIKTCPSCLNNIYKKERKRAC